MRLAILVVIVTMLAVPAFSGGAPGFSVFVHGANYPNWPDNSSSTSAAIWNEYDQPFFTASYNETSTWAAISKPGGKNGRWSSTNSNYLFDQIWTIEGNIWSGLQESRSQFTVDVTLSNDPMGYYWSFKLQRPDGTIVDQWQTNSLAYQQWSYTLPTVKLPLANWKEGYKFTVVVSDNPLPAPSSIGQVKSATGGSLVTVENAVVTASALTPGVSFVESPDRSAGIKVLANQPLTVGQRVSLTGKVGRVDGEYQIDTQNPTPLNSVFMNTRIVGNDTSQTLSYKGINTTGLLVSLSGKVTKTIPLENVFYVDDGVGYTDGYGSGLGIRVQVPTGVTLPTHGEQVRVTGISRVEKHVLPAEGGVNGIKYPEGTTVYIPVLWTRDANDVVVF